MYVKVHYKPHYQHTLGGATLDVFRQEPLPEESPYGTKKTSF